MTNMSTNADLLTGPETCSLCVEEDGGTQRHSYKKEYGNLLM
jgi:hypothetical protein